MRLKRLSSQNITLWLTQSSAESDLPCLQPEWAQYMVESTPAMPYSGKLEDLFDVEKSMKRR